MRFCVCVVCLQPPTQNMPMGPGGMSQSGPSSQPPHGHNMPSEGMVSGGPPAPHMQNQMNGQMPGKWPPSLLSTSLPYLFFFPLLLPQSLSHLGCLATPQSCEGGRSAEGWCHPFTSISGHGLVHCFIMVIRFSLGFVFFLMCALVFVYKFIYSIIFKRQLEKVFFKALVTLL